MTGTVDVVVKATSTNGSNKSDLALMDDAGNKIVAVGATSGINVVTGTDPVTEIKYTGLEAGTYSIVSPKDGENTGRGVRLLNVVVTQTTAGEKPPRADWSTVVAPVIGDITTEDGKVKVPFTMVIGDNGADSVVVTMTDKDGNKKEKSYFSNGESGSVEFAPSASGDYTFSIKATRTDEEDKVGTDKVYGYDLPLTKANIIAAYNKGNGSVAVLTILRYILTMQQILIMK